MTSPWHPFLLVRPCGLPFLREIRQNLSEAGFQPDSEQVVPGWIDVARTLYLDKFGDRSSHPPRLQDGAEAWLTATVALFGPDGLLLSFGQSGAESVRMATAEWLADYKERFRDRRRGLREPLAVTYTIREHAWPVFFDCVHVPDVNIARIRWELNVILDATRISHWPATIAGGAAT